MIQPVSISEDAFNWNGNAQSLVWYYVGRGHPTSYVAWFLDLSVAFCCYNAFSLTSVWWILSVHSQSHCAGSLRWQTFGNSKTVFRCDPQGPLLCVLYTAELSHVVARHDMRLHQYAVDVQLYVSSLVQHTSAVGVYQFALLTSTTGCPSADWNLIHPKRKSCGSVLLIDSVRSTSVTCQHRRRNSEAELLTFLFKGLIWPCPRFWKMPPHLWYVDSTLISSGVIRYCSDMLTWSRRTFSSGPHTWAPGVINTNCTRKAQAWVLDITFSERNVNVWNSLSDEVNFRTVKSFTRTIKRVPFNDFVSY